MRFTIFGASGFIGGHLETYLRKSGHDVFTPQKNLPINCKKQLGHVIYAIGLTGDFRKKPFETIDANVNALAERIRYAKFKSWLYVSSTRIYEKNNYATNENKPVPVFPSGDEIYNLSKLLGESICLSFKKQKTRVVRISNVIGQNQNKNTFIGSIIRDIKKNNNIIIKENKNSCKDYICISDVVQILVKIAIKGKYKIYNLASGFRLKHKEIMNSLVKNRKCKIKYCKNGQKRKFPKISIKRIKKEFNFNPKQPLPEIIRLLK